MKDHDEELKKLWKNRQPDLIFPELEEEEPSKGRKPLDWIPLACFLAGTLLSAALILTIQANQHDHLAELYDTHPKTYGPHRATLYKAKKRYCQPGPIVALTAGFDAGTCRTKEAAEMKYAYNVEQATTEQEKADVYSDSPDIDAVISEHSDAFKKRQEARIKAKKQAEAARIANAAQQEAIQ
jgi:hypothetical protein